MFEGWLSLRGKDVRNSGRREGRGFKGIRGQDYGNSCSSIGLLTVRTYTGGIFTAGPFTGLSQVHTCNTYRARVAPARSNRSPMIHTGYNVVFAHKEETAGLAADLRELLLYRNTFTFLVVSRLFFTTKVRLIYLFLFSDFFEC